MHDAGLTGERTGSVPERSTHARPHPFPGFLVVLEGPDGSGKSTQANLLADWLRHLGRAVVSCRDPGGTGLGDLLRNVLLNRHDLVCGVRAEMLLYMASRAQMVEEVIQPALAAGQTVVCDRFLLSNVVYQGYAAGLPPQEIWDVGRIATAGISPDLTLVLDLPGEVGARRIQARARDRIESRGQEYQDRVRQGYLDAARGGRDRERITVLDASAHPSSVAEWIKREVLHALERLAGS